MIGRLAIRRSSSGCPHQQHHVVDVVVVFGRIPFTPSSLLRFKVGYGLFLP